MATNIVTNRVTNQGVWIGAGVASENVVTPFLNQVGAVYVSGGKAYQLVQVKSTSSTVAVGAALGWTDLANFVVSALASDWIGRGIPAGVALGTITAVNYGWIQVEGPGTVNDDGNNAQKGTSLILSATNGAVNNVAAGTATTYDPIGIATANASGAGGTIAIMIQGIRNGW